MNIFIYSLAKKKRKKNGTYGFLDRLGRSRSGFLKECVDGDSHCCVCVFVVDEKRVRYMRIVQNSMDEMMTSERRYDATGERFSLPQFFSFFLGGLSFLLSS